MGEIKRSGLKKVFFYVKPSFVSCFCLSDLQRKQIVDWSLGIHKKIFFSFLSFFHPGNAYMTNSFPVFIPRKWTANKSHEWLYSIETNKKSFILPPYLIPFPQYPCIQICLVKVVLMLDSPRKQNTLLPLKFYLWFCCTCICTCISWHLIFLQKWANFCYIRGMHF